MHSVCIKRIVFVCDADVSTGLGHFLRCISLAIQMRQVGYDSHFFGKFSAQAVMFARYFGISIEQSDLTVSKRLRKLPDGTKVVLDSYNFESSELVSTLVIVVIDDFCLHTTYPVAGVINFTLNAKRYDYLTKGAARQALGLNFFLPHPSLLNSRSCFKETIKRVLVLIGSDDPYHIADKIVEAVLSVKGAFAIRVVTSRFDIETLCPKRPEVSYVPRIPNINKYYEWADFCITSGGLAKYECAYMAKPAAVVSLTDAECSETSEFALSNLCFDLGFYANLQSDLLSKRLAELIQTRAERLRAYQSCINLFNEGFSAGVAKFVEDCLEDTL